MEVAQWPAGKREWHLTAMNENIREKHEQRKGDQPVTSQNAEDHGINPAVAKHENVATPK